MYGDDNLAKAMDFARRASGPPAGPYRVYSAVTGRLIAVFENHVDVVDQSEE